jgi:hypothetical protein
LNAASRWDRAFGRVPCPERAANGSAFLQGRLRYGTGLLLAFVLTAGAHAADAQQDNWFTVTIENDCFVGKDNGYTNGAGVSWAHAGLTEFTPENLPGWLHFLSENTYISTLPGKERAVSYSMSQLIQTPSDLNASESRENDAPYVGLLVWFGNLYSFDTRVSDRLSLGLGVVGPLSGAEQTQKWAHQVFVGKEPQGWDHQLDNEPVFQVSAERLLRLAGFTGDAMTDMDVIGSGSVAAGNLESYLAVGLGGRVGSNLGRTFPAAGFLPGRQVNPLAGTVTGGWYLFLNVQGRFVANDITINGNTFGQSDSVPLEHWQAAASTGVAFGFHRWAFLLSGLVATNRFEGQPDSTRFGSISITYAY